MHAYGIISYRLYYPMLPELPAMATVLSQQASQRLVRFRYYRAAPRKLVILQRQHHLKTGALLFSRTTLDGLITQINHAFIEATGYNREELIGMPHCIIRHPDMRRRFFVDLWTTILSGLDWHGHLKNLRKDGRYYWSCTKISPEFTNGRISGFIAVSTKIPGQTSANPRRLYSRTSGSDGSSRSCPKRGHCLNHYRYPEGTVFRYVDGFGDGAPSLYRSP